MKPKPTNTIRTVPSNIAFRGDPNTTCHGTDPEAFLVDAQGKPLAAHQIGLGDRDHKLSGKGKNIWGYSLFRDGWAAEINTEYGGECRAFVGNCVRFALYALAEAAKKQHARISLASAMEIPLDVVRNGPKDLQEVGCNPAFNAYTGVAGVPANYDPLRTPYRMTGVHLHSSIGDHMWEKPQPKNWWDSFNNVKLFVKMADVYVGLAYTYLLGTENSGLRRQYYGQAGEFRCHDYGKGRGTMGCGYLTMATYYGGIEYRVPGGEVLVDHALLNMGFAVLRRLYLFFGAFAEVYEPRIGEEIRHAINRGVSHPDLLDLIQPCPGVYDKELLRFMRDTLYGKLGADDFILDDPASSFGWKDECHTGWGERVQKSGFPHHERVFRA